MKRTSLSAALCALPVVLLAIPLLLPQGSLLVAEGSSERLIARYFEALGGVDRYRQIADRHVEFVAETRNENPDLNSTFKWSVSHKTGGSLRVRRQIGVEIEIYGTDGEDYWWKPSRSKLAVDAAANKKEMQLDASLEGLLLDPTASGYSVEFDEKKPHQLRFHRGDPESPAPGDEVIYVFDKESGLISELSLLRPGASAKSVTRYTMKYEDYENASGIPFARKLTISRRNRVIMEARVTKVELGKKFPENYFRRPIR